MLNCRSKQYQQCTVAEKTTEYAILQQQGLSPFMFPGNRPPLFGDAFGPSFSISGRTVSVSRLYRQPQVDPCGSEKILIRIPCFSAF
jgi:hypothetical protein